jgi:hypothetical protein
VLSASSIRPTPCISTLPSSETVLSLQLRLPCQCCNKFWVDMAIAPLSCGCLFHPYCLWKLVLAGSMTCPGCKCKISEQWLQQWGFEVSTTMVVEVNNSLVNEDGKGMLPPKPLQLRHTQAIKHSRVDDAVGKV